MIRDENTQNRLVLQDSRSPVAVAAGNPRIFRSLVSDSFVVRRSTSLTQNSLPKIKNCL